VTPLEPAAGTMGRSAMALTNPWLAGPAPTKKLDHERLSERILNLLSSQNMCVLATTGSNGPLATPVRYYHLDFAIIFTASARSPKMRNLADDPRISLGVFAPLVGQASSRGAQIFGRAVLLRPGNKEFDRYWEAYRWQSDHVERGNLIEEPPVGPLVVVDARRIVYTEHWLRREGYAPRQFWRPKESAATTSSPTAE
jgi:nitroimidazol reductase NimA-like FMN-containing flavoprotein (pyridoxamine 5'-phosphate oxidase superfamily)